MQKYIIIKADTNDADYVHSIEPISDDNLERYAPVFAAIKAFKEKNPWTHSWPDGEYVDGSLDEIYADVDPELITEFSELVPRGEYGVHSIDSIKVYEVAEVRELL